jgi:hypothetical protein
MPKCNRPVNESAISVRIAIQSLRASIEMIKLNVELVDSALTMIEQQLLNTPISEPVEEECLDRRGRPLPVLNGEDDDDDSELEVTKPSSSGKKTKAMSKSPPVKKSREKEEDNRTPEQLAVAIGRHLANRLETQGVRSDVFVEVCLAIECDIRRAEAAVAQCDWFLLNESSRIALSPTGKQKFLDHDSA